MNFQRNSEKKTGWMGWWDTQARRIDALNFRERALLFASFLACLGALFNFVWLAPAQLAYEQSVQLFNRQSAALQRERDALRQAAIPEGADKGVRDEIAAVKGRLDNVNRLVMEHLPVATEKAPLELVLVHLLRQQEGLTLLRTAVSQPKISTKTASEPVPHIGTPEVAMSLTTQSVELTVAGRYPALVAYVQALEETLPNARWDSMSLKSATGPTELTLQLSLIGVQ